MTTLLSGVARGVSLPHIPLPPITKPMSRNDQFTSQVMQIVEFLHFNERFPRRSSHNELERSLANFVKNCRRDRSKTPAWKVNTLLHTHANFFNYPLVYDIDRSPSADWEFEFSLWAHSLPNDLGYCDPVTSHSYLSATGSQSTRECIICSLGIHSCLEPSDIFPGLTAPPGDMRHFLLCMLHPPASPVNHSKPCSPSGTAHNLLDHLPGHVHSGVLFLELDLPQSLCLHIENLKKSLLPNNLLSEIQGCTTAADLISVIDQKSCVLDTFHYDKGGRYACGGLIPITASSMKQPCRASFSAFVDPPTHFPCLRSNCQRLYV